MNVSLRVSMLSTLWHHATRGWPKDGLTLQQLYGVAATAEITDIYVYTAEKFLAATLPWYQKIVDEKSKQITYEFPPAEDCVRHMLYEVLLKNRSTFVRFILNTYCVDDPDSVLSTHDLWAFILQWGRKYDIEPAYIPISNLTLGSELEDFGYVRSSGGFWGLRLATNG